MLTITQGAHFCPVQFSLHFSSALSSLVHRSLPWLASTTQPSATSTIPPSSYFTSLWSTVTLGQKLAATGLILWASTVYLVAHVGPPLITVRGRVQEVVAQHEADMQLRAVKAKLHQEEKYVHFALDLQKNSTDSSSRVASLTRSNGVHPRSDGTK